MPRAKELINADFSSLCAQHGAAVYNFQVQEKAFLAKCEELRLEMKAAEEHDAMLAHVRDLLTQEEQANKVLEGTPVPSITDIPASVAPPATT